MQAIDGVESVTPIVFRRQGQPDPAPLESGVLPIGRLEIARLANDPNFPERGKLDDQDGRRQMNGLPLRSWPACRSDGRGPRRVRLLRGHRRRHARAAPEPAGPDRDRLSRRATYASFRASQLARLSAAENVALRRLKSRETDDFSIALIDAWSCVCDVLSFYQERNANEAFLGTAVERRSMVELGRLIGYRLRPGVAAGTDLVFLLDNPPGQVGNAVKGQLPAPSVATDAVDIPSRTRVQSIPGPARPPRPSRPSRT